jgi:hypothetical protein
MGQEVQVVRPVNGNQTSEREAGKAANTVAVPVDWPALQLLQETVETVLNLAMSHAVQVLAPAAVSVLVTDPALQAVQLFALHPPEQPAPVDGMRRYLPAAQAVHDIAPMLEPVLVTEPGLQLEHAAFVVPALYVPAGQAEQLDAPVVHASPKRVWPDAKFVATSVAERALL